ncbi:J domain-containing protein [Nocardioides marmoraquaticus]
MPSFYEVLGVAPTASAEQLRRAHREAARRTHPDAGGRPADFLAVQRAWEVLGDPARRVEYDRWLLRASPSEPVVADEPWRRPTVGFFSTRSTVLGPVVLTGTMLVLVLWTVEPVAAAVALVAVLVAVVRLLRGRSVAVWLVVSLVGVVGLAALAVLSALGDTSPTLPGLAAMGLAVHSAAVAAASYVRGRRRQ